MFPGDASQCINGAGQDGALAVRRERREVFVQPAVTGQLVTGRDDRRHALGEGLDRVAGHEPSGRDALAVEQLQDPARPDAGPELAARDGHGAVAAAHLGGDRVVVEGEGNGQAR